MTNKKAKGIRKKTRNKFNRGKNTPRLTIQKLLKSFEPGSTVHVHIDSSVHAGLPHQRYQGLTGTVIAKRGTANIVELNLGNAVRKITVHSAHLKEKKSKKAA